MVKPPRLTSNRPAVRPASPTPPASTSKGSEQGSTGFMVILGVVTFIVLVGKCSSVPDTSADGLSNMMESNIAAGVASQDSPKVERLDLRNVVRGTSHFRLAYRAEGVPGAMIYSQNCYDALVHKFSWPKLDTCGAFDMLAVRAADGIEPADAGREADYFQSEVAAGRYLAAATGAGEEPTEADRRLGDLQARIARSPLPTPEPKPVETKTEANELVPNATDEGANAVETQAAEMEEAEV